VQLFLLNMSAPSLELFCSKDYVQR